ncbi:MAG: carboxypeptidase regulatory-like domain-containing protein [Bacteroidetes bacterium]|nr:carboxypeptidase regulatory-like domain-containing protein [Bacteroidota bacterium]
MMKRIYLVFSCILLLSILYHCKKDTTPLPPGSLKGKITNENGHGIERATVQIGDASLLTNDDGTFTFSKVNPGEYIANVSKSNYLPTIQKVQVRSNEVSTLNLTLKSGDPLLGVSANDFDFSALGESLVLSIVSNSDWMIEHCRSSWYYCTDSVGSGNATFSVICSKNESRVSRKDSIIIRSGSLSRKIIIRQYSGLVIESITGIIGNGELDMKDSVLVRFNKAITLVSINNNDNICQPDINYSLQNFGKALEFTYGCARLGMQYPLTLKLKDEKGLEFSMDIVANFYDHKLDFPGSLSNSILSPDEKSIWLVTRNPNKLFHISADSLEIISSTDLPYPPNMITYNSYNNLLYISSSDPSNYYYDNHLYVHSTLNGELIKSIKIKDNPPDVVISNCPYSLCFASNGLGVLILTSKYAGHDWCMINSALEDSIYYHPHHASGDDYGQVYLAYDHNRILMQQQYASRIIGILDATTQAYTTFEPFTSTSLIFLAPSKVNADVFFGQIYDQCIMGLDDQSHSRVSYLDCRFEGSADFAYRIGHEKHVFYCDEDFLQLLDYDNATTLMWCDNVYNIRDFRVTVDGKSAYGYTWTSLFKFNTDTFYRNAILSGGKGHNFHKH